MIYLDVCHFGSASESRLITCSANLQLLLRTAIRLAPKYLDFGIPPEGGHRGKVAQDLAYAQGRSQKRWPHGNHNSFPSKAVDIKPASPWDADDWTDHVRFARIVGFIECVAVQLELKIRVGLDWNMDGRSRDERFKDLGHIEEA